MGAALLTGTAGPAAAASTCSGKLLGNWQITGGYIAVYYNSSTGNNCAMTYTNRPGVTQEIFVGISVWDSTKEVTQTGNFKYYAGPVSVYAKGKCIGIEGRVGGGTTHGVGPLYCD